MAAYVGSTYRAARDVGAITYNASKHRELRSMPLSALRLSMRVFRTKTSLIHLQQIPSGSEEAIETRGVLEMTVQTLVVLKMSVLAD
jgi:hypothetical protein